MAFNVAGARKEGYTDEEIASFLAGERNFDLDGALSEGYTPSDVIEHLSGRKAKLESASDVANATLRGLGTGLSTLPDLAQIIATRGAAMSLPDEERWGTQAREALAGVGLAREPGVPPEGLIPRAAEFLGAGAIPYLGMAARGAQLGRAGVTAGTNLLDRMALSAVQRPGLAATGEVLGATGAAAGGEYAASDYPDNPRAQFLLELLGGLAAPAALSSPTVRAVDFATRQTVGRGRQMVRGMRDPSASSQRAAGRLQEAAGDVPEALRRLEEETLLPMTIGQRIGSPATVGIEQAAAEASPEISARLGAITQEAQRLAREIPLRGMEGEAADVERALLAQRRKVARRVGGAQERLQGKADASMQALGDPDDLVNLGVGTNKQIKGAYELGEEAEDAAWAGVNKASPINYDNTIKQYDALISGLGRDTPKAKVVPAWIQHRLDAYKRGSLPEEGSKLILPEGVTRELAETPPFRTVGDLTEFRSFILEESRIARAAGERKKAAFLNKLQSAILDDLEGVPGLENARAVSRNLNETFRQGKIGQLLGHEETGEALVSPEATLRSIFTGSREQVAANLSALEKATPESRRNVEAFLRSEFLNTVYEKGKKVPGAAQAFLGNGKYAEALKQFPGLKAQLSNASEMDRLATQAAKLKTKVTKGLHARNKSVLSMYLDADPGQGISEAMSTRTPYKTMQQLYARVRKDPRARQGLQAETIRYILDQSTKDGVMTAKALKDNLRKFAPALDGVALRPAERGRLERVARELERIETPSGPKHIIDDLQNRMFTRALQVMGAKAAKLSPYRGDIQTPGILSQEGKRISQNVLSKADKARDAIIAAIMDEQVYKEMLARPSVVKNSGKPKTMRQLRTWMVGLDGEEDE